MASRMGFDLTNKHGRRNFFSEAKHGRYNLKLMFIDTFTQFYCRVVGHKTYETEDKDLACRRCWHYVNSPHKG